MNKKEKFTVKDKPKFTGKQLVMLDAKASANSVNTKAKNASIRLASFSDYSKDVEKFHVAFEEADGIVFEEFGVAVINKDMNRQVSMLTDSSYSKSTFLYSEPERYVYAIASKTAKSTSKNLYKDDKNAYWGIQATNVLNTKYTGKSINIAILDTGFNLKHSDFKGRKIQSKSFITGEMVEDKNGHGSHCTGISSGNISGKKGSRYGVAKDASIFIGKVLSNKGSGNDSGILAGMEWAVENKCKVISMSLGAEVSIGEPYSNVYNDVAKRILKKGTIIIAAAGNESYRKKGQINPVGHPANCPAIMAVAAIDNKLRVADFSCGGINVDGGQVDIAAPGVDIYSSWKSPELYNIINGTSMATPFVAGIAVLYWEANPGATASDIWMYLTQNSKRMELNSTDVGAGLVQAPK